MSIDSATLRRLSALRLDPEQMAGVLDILAGIAEADEVLRNREEARKAKDAERKRNKRASADIPRTSGGQDVDAARTPPDGPPFPPAPPIPPLNPPKHTQRDARDGDFERFWAAYPAKVGKDAAKRSFSKAIAAGVTVETMLIAIERYRRAKPPDRDWCHPTTWLNQGRWNDEHPEPAAARSSQRPGSGSRPPRGHDALLALLDPRPVSDPDFGCGPVVDHWPAH
jgi:hypothetical protein